MKFFTIILLTLNTCLFGQVYQRNWPDKMLEAINAGQSDVTGTIYGDTLFHFWKEEGRYCLIDPKFYFEVIPQLHGHFRVDLYNNKAAKFGGEIIYSSFFNADSIKYKQINAPGNPTGIIDFYENGKVRLNHQ